MFVIVPFVPVRVSPSVPSMGNNAGFTLKGSPFIAGAGFLTANLHLCRSRFCLRGGCFSAPRGTQLLLIQKPTITVVIKGIRISNLTILTVVSII